jgi:hypothetical protein
MHLLDQLSEHLIAHCLELLDELWGMGGVPGDDACTGRFDLRCQRCAFVGVLYGFVCERQDHPRAAVSLEPYTLP